MEPETRICEVCGTHFLPKSKARPGRFCSARCYWMSGPRGYRVDRTKDHRLVTRHDHPLSPPGGRIPVARIVLYDHIGPGPHACHWCKAIVNWLHGLATGCLVVDHLDFDNNNDAIENLVPSCLACNGHRRKSGDTNLIKEGEPTVLINGKPTRAVERKCEYCGKQFLAVPAKVRAGRGRFCSADCGYANRSTPDMSGVK